MSRSGFPILFHIKNRRFAFKCKYYLPYIGPSERFFSIQAGGNNDDQNPKDGNNTLKQDESGKTTAVKTETSLKESKEGIRAAAKKKLFSLLSEFKIEDSNKKVGPGLNLARAVKRPPKKERFKDILAEQQKPPDAEMQEAAKNVSMNVSGDPEQTLSELKEKLSSLHLIIKPESETDPSEEDTAPEVKINEDIMSSVKEVAASVTDSSSAPIRSKLTERLMRLNLESKSSVPKKSIENIVKDMKVETRKHQERKIDPSEQSESPRGRQFKGPTERAIQSKINIFQSPPLGLFSPDIEIQAETKKTVWQKLEEKNLKLLVEFAPRNAYEEMIMWTEQGRHWSLPVNNEIDMGEEENVGFHKHVFLEEHLHGFPTKGPVRHFMELVTVGLSKNPYITVERKIENIDWFRNYFNEKEDILKQYGAIES